MTPGQARQTVTVESLGDPRKFGYEHCVRAGNLVFISGQLGVATDDASSNDFEDQARRTLDKVTAAVEACGGNRSDILSMTVYITDISDGRKFAAIRKEFFGDVYPTSALVGVSALMIPNATIEIQAVAAVGD